MSTKCKHFSITSLFQCKFDVMGSLLTNRKESDAILLSRSIVLPVVNVVRV